MSDRERRSSRRPARGGPRRTRPPEAAPARAYAFGRRAAAEALAAGAAVRLLVGRRTAPADLVREAGERGVPVEETDTARLDALSGGVRHQGVAVEVRPPEPLGERDLEERAWADDAVVVVLDGVEDPQNVGAAARAAEVAGASALVLRERRAAGITPAAVRASAGALLHLPVAVVANVRRALDRLRGAGFTVLGLDGDAPTSIYEMPPPAGRVALVVGSESAGLSRLVREGCDLLVALPVRGRIGSLNASAAVAAALYAAVVPARIAGGSGALPPSG